MKKLGLALGAGGSRGVAHIGFLQAIEEEGIKVDCISGSSMGSVVGAAYAKGIPLEEIKEAVFHLRLLDLIAPTRKRGGVFGTRKMRAVLEKHLGDVNIEDLKIPFSCLAVDMITQKTIEFKEGSLLDAVVASASIPGIFHPLEKDGMRLVDGGILERVPVKQVKALGADVVVAVDVLGWLACKEECPGTIGILIDTEQIMDNYRTKQRRAENADIIDLWLEPDLGNMSPYSFKMIRFAYEKGYELGKANVKKIKKLVK